MISDIRLSWRNILLAPLVVPLLLAGLLTAASSGSAIFAFVFFLILGSLVSYGSTIFLLLPCLYLLSKYSTLRWYWVGLCGIALGTAVYFPVAWIGFRASGPDSGPPVGTFLEYLWQSRTDPFNWIFPLAGGTTALAYWFFGPRPLASRPNFPDKRETRLATG